MKKNLKKQINYMTMHGNVIRTLINKNKKKLLVKRDRLINIFKNKM